MANRVTAVTGVTLIDGLGGTPVPSATVVFDGERFVAAGPSDTTTIPDGAVIVDAAGQTLIPGFVNGNVHLLDGWTFMVGAGTIEYLSRWEGRFVEVIEEAAQLTLRNGVTSVFDTFNAVGPVLEARDRINAGTSLGSRIFAAGTIVGMGGPFTADFDFTGRLSATQTFAHRMNEMFEAGVGHQLTTLTRADVRARIRDYLARGVDMLKIAVSDHVSLTIGMDRSYHTFTPAMLDVLVDEARSAGVPVLTHNMSLESLETAIDIGSDVLIHTNYTSGQVIPPALIDRILKSGAWCELQTVNEAYTKVLEDAGNFVALLGSGAFAENERLLIAAGAPIILGTDAGCSPKDLLSDLTPAEREDRPWSIGGDHFHWAQGMVERGMTPLAAITASTSSVARAYGKGDLFGSVEPGKLADFVLLDADPLADIKNLRSISAVYKAGEHIDRDALPVNALVTGHPA
jgi:imidazolonepropionase-like amidohydrolase